MGKGSSTSQKGVVKPKIKHIVGDGGGSPLQGGYDEEEKVRKDLCLFAIDLKIKLPNSDLNINRGDHVALVQVSAGEITIFVKNRPLLEYTGQQKNRLLKCMAKGYVYSGQVRSIGANTLRATVSGGVLSHATA